MALTRANPKFLRNEKVIAIYKEDFFLSRVMKIRRSKNGYKYLLHFINWNSLWDEWKTEEEILKITKENFEKYNIEPPKKLQLPTEKELRAHQEPLLAIVKFKNIKTSSCTEEGADSTTKPKPKSYNESNQTNSLQLKIRSQNRSKPGVKGSKQPKFATKAASGKVKSTPPTTNKKVSQPSFDAKKPSRGTKKAASTNKRRSHCLPSIPDDFMSAEEASPQSSKPARVQVQFVADSLISAKMTNRDQHTEQPETYLKQKRNRKGQTNCKVRRNDASGMDSSVVLMSPDRRSKPDGRRSSDNDVHQNPSQEASSKDQSMAKTKCIIPLPDALRFILVNDHSLIHDQDKFIKLPAQTSVEKILQNFRSSIADELNAHEAIFFRHQFKFIEECFDFLLPKELLYKCERKFQLQTILTQGTPPSHTCGGIHLLRLLAKLEAILNANFVEMMTLEEIDLSEKLLLRFFKFLDDSKSDFFSEAEIYAELKAV